MKDNGKMIDIMGKELYLWPKVLLILEIGQKIKKMVQGNIFGLMVIIMKVNGLMGKGMAKVFINGLMEINIKEIGLMIKEMEMVSIKI